MPTTPEPETTTSGPTFAEFTPAVVIGDPRQAGQAGPAGDQRQAGQAGPAGDTRQAGEAAPRVRDLPTPM